LDEILSRVKDIQITVQNDNKARKCILPEIAKPNDIAPTEERMMQIQRARSLDELLDNCDELKLLQQADYGYVICKLLLQQRNFRTG